MYVAPSLTHYLINLPVNVYEISNQWTRGSFWNCWNLDLFWNKGKLLHMLLVQIVYYDWTFMIEPSFYNRYPTEWNQFKSCEPPDEQIRLSELMVKNHQAKILIQSWKYKFKIFEVLDFGWQQNQEVPPPINNAQFNHKAFFSYLVTFSVCKVPIWAELKLPLSLSLLNFLLPLSI